MGQKLGLALGGGGVRGLAHIGVLKALEDAHIPVEMIAGTSMGGIIGAQYAAGRPAQAILEESRRMASITNLARIVEWRFGRRGLIRGRQIADYFDQLLGPVTTFADLPIALALTATDLRSGEEIVLNSGPVGVAMRASMALPGILDPVVIGDRLLVDGGLRNNVPADVVRHMGADVVLAVDVSAATNLVAEPVEAATRSLQGILSPRDLVGDLMQTVMIMIKALTDIKLALGQPTVLLRPELPAGATALGGAALLDDIVAAGEQAAVAALPVLRTALGLAEPAPAPVEQEQPAAPALSAS
jgi:NTE family protein